MKKPIETERLILRELKLSDAEGMFELDSNPNVHLFLGNRPVKHIDESIEYIKFVHKQYKDLGTGRWAVVLKETNEFIGWSGIKFITNEINNHKNFYEIGYRLKEEFWGKGYAYEAALKIKSVGMNDFGLTKLSAITTKDNTSSQKLIEKLGLKFQRFVKIPNDPEELMYYETE